MPRQTPEEKEQKRFAEWLSYAETKGTQYYPAVVAKTFQLMIRAEAGAKMAGEELCVVRGVIDYSYRDVGEVICVTCGKRGPWKGGSSNRGGGMQTGHYEGSRRLSILFEPDNVAVQCYTCNIIKSGNKEAFTPWMLKVRGQAVLDRLSRLRNEQVKYDLEKLVEMRLGYDARLKAAVEKMK